MKSLGVIGEYVPYQDADTNNPVSILRFCPGNTVAACVLGWRIDGIRYLDRNIGCCAHVHVHAHSTNANTHTNAGAFTNTNSRTGGIRVLSDGPRYPWPHRCHPTSRVVVQ